MASTSCVVSKVKRKKSVVKASEITTEFVEDVLDSDSDIELDFSDNEEEINNDDVGTVRADCDDENIEPNISEIYVPVGSREDSEMWQEQNDAPQIKCHKYTDILNSVQPESGINVESTPIDIFKNFFDRELVTLICRETNLYQRKVKENLLSEGKLGPKSRIHKWVDVSEDDVYRFLALIILMGVIRKPTLQMYWSTDEMLATPFFGKCMSHNRFSSILRFLHFSSNLATDDKLNKIRPIFSHLITKFMSAYRPGEKNYCRQKSYIMERLPQLEAVYLD